MAIWQFNVYLIPKRSLVNKYGIVPGQLDFDNDNIENSYLEEETDFQGPLSNPWWLDLDVSFGSLLVLFQNFGPEQEWAKSSRGFKTFGDSDSNDFSVDFNEETNKIEAISCRIDLRAIDNDFLHRIFVLAERFDCLLMDGKGVLYNPTLSDFQEAVMRSNAARFVDDPERFLNDISNGIIKPE